MFGFKKKKHSSVGLEISSKGFRFICLDLKKDKTVLRRHGFENFEADIFQNGLIVDKTVFSSTLNQLVKKYNLKNTPLSISVPSNIVFIKTITLPDLPKEELQSIILQESAKHIPFPAEDVNIDFEILEHSKQVKDSANLVDVILVAVSKNIIKDYSEIFKTENLKLEAIDVKPFSVLRTLAFCNEINTEDDIFVSIAIGNKNTDINIIKNGMPIFSHNILFGEQNILESLTSSLNISKQEAKEMLKDTDLINNEKNHDPLSNQLSSVLKTTLNSFYIEIQKTLEFYASQSEQPLEIKKILLTGKLSSIKSFDKYTENKLKTETLNVNPLENIENKTISFENSYELSNCIGLALKGFEN